MDDGLAKSAGGEGVGGDRVEGNDETGAWHDVGDGAVEGGCHGVDRNIVELLDEVATYGNVIEVVKEDFVAVVNALSGRELLCIDKHTLPLMSVDDLKALIRSFVGPFMLNLIAGGHLMKEGMLLRDYSQCGNVVRALVLPQLRGGRRCRMVWKRCPIGVIEGVNNEASTFIKHKHYDLPGGIRFNAIDICAVFAGSFKRTAFMLVITELAKAVPWKLLPHALVKVHHTVERNDIWFSQGDESLALTEIFKTFRQCFVS